MLCLAISAKAQSTDTTKKWLKFKGVSFQTGLFTNTLKGQNNLADFQKLAPESELLKKNISGFDYAHSTVVNGNGPALAGNVIYEINQNNDEKRFRQELHFGFVYNSITISSLSAYKENRFRVDTLRSSQTGNQFFVDSISIESYGADYDQDQLMLSSTYIISGKGENRLKFYTGIGIAAGISVSASTNVYYSKNSYIDSEFEGRTSNGNDDFLFRSERFTNANSFLARVYLPIGLDFKLSKRSENWNKCHILLETQPNLTYSTIPELKSTINTGNLSSLGFRYDF